MNCPKCNQPAIGFIKWASGTEAFKTKCASCSESLKANVITIIGFVITALITVAFVFFVKIYLDPELSKGFLKFLLALPVAIILGFVVFKVGGYKNQNRLLRDLIIKDNICILKISKKYLDQAFGRGTFFKLNKKI